MVNVTRKRIFFLTSIAFAIVAFIIHAVARDNLEEGWRLKAKRLEIAVKQNAPYVPDPEAGRLFQNRRRLIYVGLVFTALSIICMFVAIGRRERGWYSIPLALLAFDLMALMIL